MPSFLGFSRAIHGELNVINEKLELGGERLVAEPDGGDTDLAAV